jgi:hypothetical protein
MSFLCHRTCPRCASEFIGYRDEDCPGARCNPTDTDTPAALIAERDRLLTVKEILCCMTEQRDRLLAERDELRAALDLRIKHHDTTCDEFANDQSERIAELRAALKEAIEIDLAAVTAASAKLAELAYGLLGADGDDAVGSIKVHYADGSSRYLCDAIAMALAELRAVGRTKGTP